APGERLIRCAEEEGVRAVAVPMARPIRLWQDLRSLLDLIVALRRLRPQVVNAGTPKAALLGMLAAFVLRVPVRIYLVRGLRLETVRGPLRWVLALMERLTAYCATHILYVSQSLRDVYEGLGLGPRHKGMVLLEGSSRGWTSPATDGPTTEWMKGGRYARALGLARAPVWQASSDDLRRTRVSKTW